MTPPGVIRLIYEIGLNWNMTNKEILQAIQEDPQHDFIMKTQNCTAEEATKIIKTTEEYLIKIIGENQL